VSVISSGFGCKVAFYWGFSLLSGVHRRRASGFAANLHQMPVYLHNPLIYELFCPFQGYSCLIA
jgi:hypothetical protein